MAKRVSFCNLIKYDNGSRKSKSKSKSTITSQPILFLICQHVKIKDEPLGDVRYVVDVAAVVVVPGDEVYHDLNLPGPLDFSYPGGKGSAYSIFYLGLFNPISGQAVPRQILCS